MSRDNDNKRLAAAQQSGHEKANKKLFTFKQIIESFLYLTIQQAKWFRYAVLALGVVALTLSPLAYGAIIAVGLLASVGFAVFTFFGDKSTKELFLKRGAIEKKRKDWRFWVLMAFDALLAVGAMMSLPTVVATIIAAPLAGLALGAVIAATVALILVFTLFKYIDRRHNYNKIRVTTGLSDKWSFLSPKSIVGAVLAAGALFCVSQLVLSSQGLLTAFTVFSPISLGIAVVAMVAVWVFMSQPKHRAWTNIVNSVLYGTFSATTPFFIAMALGLFTAGLSLPILIPLTILIAAVCIGIGVYAGVQKFKYNDIKEGDLVEGSEKGLIDVNSKVPEQTPALASTVSPSMSKKDAEDYDAEVDKLVLGDDTDDLAREVLLKGDNAPRGRPGA